MSDASHFDRRGAGYDADGVHRRVVERLLDGVAFAEGARVLDVATGTGLAAFAAARRVGPSGEVLGVDLSEGMLARARAESARAGVANVRFERADAERLDLPEASFDHVLCASALVMMADVPGALCLWRGLLKPGGTLAFDTPARPFGLFGRIAAAAGRHGLRLPVLEVGDTAAACRALLRGAGLEVVEVRGVTVAAEAVDLAGAAAFFDERRDHPAMRALADADGATRADVRAAFLRDVEAAADGGRVTNEVTLNLSVGRRPG